MVTTRFVASLGVAALAEIEQLKANMKALNAIHGDLVLRVEEDAARCIASDSVDIDEWKLLNKLN